ncbi:hypothetical protein [Fimbriiglobus ruber]|uniref:Thioredoxin domain-containing protein n=1 Tax=Fimbriiglobus ruber TaxID=1908690 RepID=A0A225DHV2_9BACT|nr:hypothetical protein [Fimbriiglobus ruber]OWK41051.1 hypothetical protein FRUB_04943 [Fimbriiglobus ruber]
MKLRLALFVVAVFGTITLTAPAAEKPDLAGNWLLTYTARGGSTEVNVYILTIETKDGKPTATVAATPPKASPAKVKDFQISGRDVTLSLNNGNTFSGQLGDDAKPILGGYGNEQFQYRAKLTRTDKDAIDSATSKGVGLEQLTKAQQLAAKSVTLRFQARAEKDAEKKKELLAKAEEAQKDADGQVPALYREAVEKNAEHPAATDAALALLQSAAKWKVTPDEAKALLGLIDKQSAPYGPKYARFTAVAAAEVLASQKGLEAVAVDALRAATKTLTEADPATFQVRVLTAFKAALEGANQRDEIKALDARLTVLDTKLDEEYLATVPPFKPAAFAGRKDKAATRVAVMELFTGAQCPPCVAADVAFDALAKAYRPADLILLQYHMHIPGPDPLTNPATVGRWDYYREKFSGDIRGTPSTLFNGKPAAGGGGGMANAENKFEQYRKLIDPRLEETTAIKLGGTATRRGDTVEIAVEADGLEPADGLRLRLLVVEEVVKYVGGNKLRFHHQVVRAMPGGVDGVAVKDKAVKHAATASVGSIRTGLVKYLDDFAENERPFPSAVRPLDLKDLKVVALVQNDKTGEILQAVRIDVDAGK